MKKVTTMLVIGLLTVVSLVMSGDTLADKRAEDNVYRVIAMDNRGRAIWVDEDGDLHGRLGKGFLGIGWKIVPEEKCLTAEEHATALKHEAELAEKRAEKARKMAEKAAKKAAKAQEEAEASVSIQGPPAPNIFRRTGLCIASWFKRDA